MSINRVIISGNLTRDAEMRSSASGTSVLSFGVAVNERRRNQQTGNWDDYANYINCTIFGRRAEALQTYLTKGTKVAIEGRLHYSTWENQEGQRRSRIDIYVDELEFMSSRNNTDGSRTANYAPVYGAAQPPAQTQEEAEGAQGDTDSEVPKTAAPAPAAYNDEDIPF